MSKKDYEKYGIVSIENVLPKREFSDLLNKIHKFLESEKAVKDRKYIGFDEIPFADEIIKSLVNSELASKLKEIFSDPILFPDFILQVNNTPKTMIRPHYDLQSYSRSGLANHLKDSEYAKIGFYFQPNSKDYPGSIWYIPGSHRSRIMQLLVQIPGKFIRERILTFWKNIKKNKQTPLLNKPNSFAIFDGRMLHSSSPETNEAIPNYYKYSIYFSVVGSVSAAKAFARSEITKFAEEVYSNVEDDSQRIGYVFANPFSKIANQIEALGLKFFDLTGASLLRLKKQR